MKRTLTYLLIFEIIVFGVLAGNYFLERKTKPDLYSKYYRVKVKELSDDNGWYYEIYKDSRLFIQQKNIPGALGNQYFKSKKDAQKIALLVVDKLECRILPYITKAELDSCNIDFKN
ncbi:DUF4907 domain-containing protein [Aquimarina algiphila]|uniref:DUF4907 domain-containing protein n=1 Tax=Aquimarina algiphila TaxID=2047982 RepID=UPI00232B535E|nr:DUF4907 domain-containing protein [Aquimarina algiphila]